MKNIRFRLIVLMLLVCTATSAVAQVSIGIGLPNLRIGINVPVFPELAPVPGYPVYYAPQMDGNYFFYDGMYWVYQGDNWYASSWYNGPWSLVRPEFVPLFILRVPVGYYRHPPEYFRGWRSNEPPRWGQKWGPGWEQRRRGWDRWERSSVPARAPLPVYQRQYAGDRYPRVEQQHALRNQSYRYQPRDKVIRQHFRQQAGQIAPAPRGRQEEPQMRGSRQQDLHRSTPPQQGAPDAPRSQQHQRGEDLQRPVPAQPPQQRGPAFRDQRQQPATPQRELQSPRSQGQEQRSQERGAAQEPKRDHGPGQNRDEERGRERNN